MHPISCHKLNLLPYSEQEYYQGLSFVPISASGPNGAVIHYSSTNETNRQITTNELYLIDSGGQYLDGTTDVTRTLHYGNATDFEKEAYTLVLKGAIDMAKLIFPSYLTDLMLRTIKYYTHDIQIDLLKKKTTQEKNAKIDTVARLPLYEQGLEYLHGTGHGIGTFLCVHEGPFKITNQRRIYKEELPLQEGMFMSDEPGFYQDGQFGIRLETILTVVKAKTKHQFNNQTFLGFEPVTFVPFEPRLIKLELLTKAELEWLNDYHAKVRNYTGKELLKQQRLRGYNWMLEKSKPLA